MTAGERVVVLISIAAILLYLIRKGRR